MDNAAKFRTQLQLLAMMAVLATSCWQYCQHLASPACHLLVNVSIVAGNDVQRAHSQQKTTPMFTVQSLQCRTMSLQCPIMIIGVATQPDTTRILLLQQVAQRIRKLCVLEVEACLLRTCWQHLLALQHDLAATLERAGTAAVKSFRIAEEQVGV
jgi:hypothetical protein